MYLIGFVVGVIFVLVMDDDDDDDIGFEAGAAMVSLFVFISSVSIVFILRHVFVEYGCFRCECVVIRRSDRWNIALRDERISDVSGKNFVDNGNTVTVNPCTMMGRITTKIVDSTTKIGMMRLI